MSSVVQTRADIGGFESSTLDPQNGHAHPKLASLSAPSCQDVAEVWREFLATRDNGPRNRLWVHYLFLAHTTATRVFRKIPPGTVIFDDLRSMASLGLLEAIEAFDPTSGAKFETFSQYRLRGAILDGLRELDWVSRTSRTRSQRLEELVDAFVEKHNQPPSERELNELKLTILTKEREKENARRARGPNGDTPPKRDSISAQLLQKGFKPHVAIVNTLYLDQTNSSDGSSAPFDQPDMREEDPAIKIERADEVQHLLRSLPKDFRRLMELYYMEELTMAEIGDLLDLSESRVSQIHSAILLYFEGTIDAPPSGGKVHSSAESTPAATPQKAPVTSGACDGDGPNYQPFDWSIIDES